MTREVLGSLGRGVADSLDGRDAAPAAGDLDNGRTVAREDGHSVRPATYGRPAADHRVVVAVHHEGWDPRIREPSQSTAEADLGAKSTDRAVIDVACD